MMKPTWRELGTRKLGTRKLGTRKLGNRAVAVLVAVGDVVEVQRTIDPWRVQLQSSRKLSLTTNRWTMRMMDLGQGWPNLAGLPNASQSRIVPRRLEVSGRIARRRVQHETTSHAVIVNLLVGPILVLAVIATTRHVLLIVQREALGTMRIVLHVESLPHVIATSEGATSEGATSEGATSEGVTSQGVTIAPLVVSRFDGSLLRVTEIPNVMRMPNPHAPIVANEVTDQPAARPLLVAATLRTHLAAIVNRSDVTADAVKAVAETIARPRAIAENALTFEATHLVRIQPPMRPQDGLNRAGPQIAADAAQSLIPIRKKITIGRVAKSRRSKCRLGSMPSRCLSADSQSHRNGAVPGPVRAVMTEGAAGDVGDVARATASRSLGMPVPRRFGDRKGRRC